MKKTILLLLTALLVLGGFTLFRHADQARAAAPLPQPVTWRVRTVAPAERTVMQTARFTARLEAQTRAALASKLSGHLGRVLVRESQRVEKGELLAQIDDSELRANIAGLRASLKAARSQRDYARKQLERNRELFATNGVSRDRLDASEAAYNAATGQVRELEQKIRGLENQLEYTRMTAPFDGIVGAILLREGDLAMPGKPILTINSLAQRLTFTFVPGASRIEAEQRVLIDAAPVGKVRTIYDDARKELAVAEVTLDTRLPQPIGSSVTIDVVTHDGSGCAVPLRALVHHGRQSGVMRYKAGRFHEQPVTVLARDRRFALIEPCPEGQVAVAAESRLALLPAAGERVSVARASDE